MHKSFKASARLATLAIALSLFIPGVTSAATTPSLGAAASYGILANTYINAVPGTTVTGDIGFNTAPAIVPAGVRTNFGSGAAFTAAVTDKNTALANLNAQACTFTFAAGAVDLATDATHGAVGVYTPGVYCVPGVLPAVTLGAGGITLSGSGTYIFRFNGSLITAANSNVTLAGASACDVFWTPLDNAVTSILGANSTFAGTLIGNTALNIQTNVSWTGRAFLSDGNITTAVDDTITVPSSCTPLPPSPAPATLHIVKNVINNDGGTAVAALFTLHVKGSTGMGMADVVGSPAAGVQAPGRTYSLVAGTYAVSEDAFSGYASSIGGDCSANGNVTLAAGETKTCVITNDDIAVPVVLPPVVPPVVNPPVVEPPVVNPPSVVTPEVPNTGAGGNTATNILVLLLSFAVAFAGLIELRRNHR